MKYYLNNCYSQMQACSGGQASLECPEHLYLDITNDCNLYCQMCRDKVEMTEKTMPYDLFCKLLDETAPFVKIYSLFNSGEPLLVKDFCQRVDDIKARSDARIEISTNGMLLTDDMISFLRSRKVGVCVSFDGARKKTFEAIRRGASFERVCDNLRKLSEAYADVAIQDTPSIYVTLQRDNAAELLEIAKLAHSLGIHKMGFGFVNLPSEYAPDMDAALREVIEKTASYLNDQNMLNSLYPARVGDYLWQGSKYIHMDNFILDSRCTAPLVSAMVRYNGDVYLCCNAGEYVDNVKDKSFLQVWQSKTFNDLRSQVNSIDDMPQRCRQCWWVNR